MKLHVYFGKNSQAGWTFEVLPGIEIYKDDFGSKEKGVIIKWFVWGINFWIK